MLKKLPLLLLVAILVVTLSGPARAQSKKVYYWISHGAPADPVWTYFLQGAQKWAADTGNEVKTSFHSGDVPSQQEAGRPAYEDIRKPVPAGAKSGGGDCACNGVSGDRHGNVFPVLISEYRGD